MESVANIRYHLSNYGTAAWVVWKCYEDALGYELDHMSEVVFASPSKQKALEFYTSAENLKGVA
jgi:hypothetical protein